MEINNLHHFIRMRVCIMLTAGLLYILPVPLLAWGIYRQKNEQKNAFISANTSVLHKDRERSQTSGSVLHELEEQDITITGKVVSSEDNQALPGVNITIKGTNQGTVTDANGDYKIDVPSGETVLVFSFVGFSNQEIQVGERSVIDITLSPDVRSLEEVIVVGYGTQKKVSMTSAVTEINGEELTRQPVTNIKQAFQGKLSGLTVLDKGGNPGNSVTPLAIRGINTLYATENLSDAAIAPLVLVDGVEQPFGNINPEDIESISVLKDASSTAIYGSRGSNGVILITTKRAKTGKVSVSYSGFYAIQKSISKPEPMDIESYLHLENIAYKNVGSNPPYPYRDDDIDDYVRGTKEDPLHYPLPYNWYHYILHTAPQTNHTLSVSGGNDNFRARMSLRYQRQDGIIDNTNSNLGEIRVNTDYTVSPKINISTDVDYRYEKNLNPYGLQNIFHFTMQNGIWAVPKYPNGDYGGGTQGNNPWLLIEKGGYNRVTSDYIFGRIRGEWEIVKGLKFATQIAGRTTDVFGKLYENTWQTKDSTTIKKQNLHNNLTESRNNNREYTFINTLHYTTSFGENALNLLGGYEQIGHSYSELSAYRQDFYNNDVQSIGQGANDDTKDNSGYDSEWGLRSYFARANYSFKDKYLLEANARYDGSSRFTGDNRYSFFPSFSIGWRLSEENFWSGLEDVISDFKLRGSWGETGNQAVDLYSYFSTLNLVTYDFNGSAVQGYVQRQDPNPDLTWETTKQTDVGMDAELLDGKISLSVDYYKKRTEGILLTLPVPGTLGLQAGPQNAGVVDNTGWEFLAGSHNTFGQFNLNANLNFSINKNEVVDLAGTGPFFYGSDFNPRYTIQEGYPIYSFWGYKTDGLFQTDDEAESAPMYLRVASAGDVRYVDRNGDGMIDADDQTHLGNTFPKYSFGGIFNLSYKGFTLNLAFQGVADASVRMAGALGQQGNYEGMASAVITGNYWTPENPGAHFPRPTKRDLRNQTNNDLLVLDASYFRLKNAQLVYSLPSSLMQKIFVAQASIYISGTNLLTFSQLNEWHLDPESMSGVQDYYPQVAVYTLGINLKF